MQPAHDPIAAVTQPDPYPYYASLVAERPLYFDAALGMWVASGSDAVRAVLASELCLVRPAAEPVPIALVDSPAGEIFARLVRMRDGERHAALKRAVSTALAGVDLDEAARLSDRWSQALVVEGSPGEIATISVYVVGSLLGVADDDLSDIAPWVDDFARCLAPGSSLELVERGTAAAGDLLHIVQGLALSSERQSTLLDSLAQAMRESELHDPELVAANAIGFLFQTYDATAGLIGNTLRMLLTHPDLHSQVLANPALLQQMILEVLRFDAPIQNTRRFVARDGIVAGQPMRAGDAILLVLAAANRDPALNPAAEHFQMQRADRQMFSFGDGRHACPGAALAITIAEAAVGRILKQGVDLAALVGTEGYRPSANARIPVNEQA